MPTFIAFLATAATDATVAAVMNSAQSRARCGGRGGQGAGGSVGGGGGVADGSGGSAGVGGAPGATSSDSPTAASGGAAWLVGHLRDCQLRVLEWRLGTWLSESSSSSNHSSRSGHSSSRGNSGGQDCVSHRVVTPTLPAPISFRQCCLCTSPSAAPKDASLSFTLDSRASHCFFRNQTTLTPLTAPVSIALTDPTSIPEVGGCEATRGQSRGVWIEPSMDTATCVDGDTYAPLATFNAEPGSGLYTLHTGPRQRQQQQLPPTPVTAHQASRESCRRCRLRLHHLAPLASRVGCAPPLTLHLDIWGLASRPGPERESCFLMAIDDYSRYTNVFPLVKKSGETSTLIRWLLITEGTRGRRVSCLHSDHGGLVMDIAHTSMIHACTPHFPWPYAVRYAAHQLNRWPHVSQPRASPTSLWTGSPGDASRFHVWGCLACICDTSTDKISLCVIPCVFLGFPKDSSDFTFYTLPFTGSLTLVTVCFDESVPYYTRHPCRGLPIPPPPLFLTPTPPLAPQVSSPSPRSSSQSPQQPLALPPEAAADHEGAGVCSADPRGATSGGGGVGAEPGSAGGSSLRGAGVSRAVPGGATTRGAGAPSAGHGEPGPGRVVAGGAGSGGGATGALESAAGVGVRGDGVGAAAAGATAAGGAAAAAAAAATSASYLWPSDPLSPLSLSSLLPLSSCLQPHPLLSPPLSYTWASCSPPRPSSPVPATDLRTILFHPSLPRSSLSVLPSPPELALTASLSTPVTNYYRTYCPVLSCVLASHVTDPRASLSSVSALTAAVTEFAATRRLDYTTCLVAAPPTSPLAVGGESSLGCDALEDRQFELEFLAAASPHLCAMLLAPEGDPDALDIPTPRTYAEAVSRPWASQWRAAMDSEMASYRSTGTYVDKVHPRGVKVVDGMWIFRVKRPPGSPPRSTRSSSVSTSTIEAEIYAGAMAAQELRQLTFLLTDLGERPSSALTLFTNNKAAILLCREPRLKSRVKHINIRHFLLQELQRDWRYLHNLPCMQLAAATGAAAAAAAAAAVAAANTAPTSDDAAAPVAIAGRTAAADTAPAWADAAAPIAVAGMLAAAAAAPVSVAGRTTAATAAAPDSVAGRTAAAAAATAATAAAAAPVSVAGRTAAAAAAVVAPDYVRDNPPTENSAIGKKSDGSNSPRQPHSSCHM
ncbi:unnamed protein product [Closterium sp. NIES-54]